MKQKDYAVIIASAGISVILAFFLANTLIGSPKNRQAEVKILDPISSNFPIPTDDDKYFNAQSINPTQPVQIGPNNNQQPFNK